jgi:hypothetical protein
LDRLDFAVEARACDQAEWERHGLSPSIKMYNL